MKHLVLSIEDVKKDCIKLSQKINKSNFKPDCIVYIKCGAYLVGKYMSDFFNIQCRGLRISRVGNNRKEKLKFVLKIMPNFIKNILRELEFKSGIHKRNSKRNICEVDSNLIYGKNILLIDDSVDTGNSIVSAVNFLKNNYDSNLSIKVATLNKFKISEDVIKTDYYIYEDSIIIYPWSKDSKQYNEFINLYSNKT